MNKSYRLVWSASRQAYVVAHENAKARGKSTKVAGLLLALTGVLGAAPMSWAASDCVVGAGQTGASCVISASGQPVEVGTGGEILGLPGVSAVTINTINAATALTNVGIDNSGKITATDASALSLYAGEGMDLRVDAIDNATGATISATQNLSGANTHAIDINGTGANVSIGSLNNAGTIQSNGQRSAAIRAEGDVTIRGNIDNSGLINGNGYYGTGIDLKGTQVQGKIINRQGGVISTTDDYSGAGLSLSQGASVNGGLSNAGSISSVYVTESTLGGLSNLANGSIGNANIAIYLGNGAQIIGNLSNDGKIISGDTAILARDSSITGDLLNNGTLSGAEWGLQLAGTSLGNLINGNGAIIEGGEGAINAYGGTLNALRNQGTLNSSEGHGIQLSDLTVEQELSNTGLISAATDGITLRDSTLKGNLFNSGLINAGGDAIYISGSTLMADLINDGRIVSREDAIDINDTSIAGSLSNLGRIESDDDGFDLDELTLGGDLVNQGQIVAQSSGIRLSESTVSGQVHNTSTGIINGVDEGLRVIDSTITGGIRNDGTIVSTADNGVELNNAITNLTNTGLISGVIGVAAFDGDIDQINNSGVIQGEKLALWLDGTQNTAITVSGTQARFIGDVKATDSTFTLTTGSTFTNEGAIDVARFDIAQGATLLMGVGTSKTKGEDLDSSIAKDGITVGSAGFNNSGTLALGATTVGTLHGNYTQDSTGVLKVGVNNNTTFGKLVVDGNATLANNAKIVVDVANPNYKFNVASMQDILSATHLNSNGSFAVSDNSVLFDFGARKDGNTVDLTLTASAAAHAGSAVESIVRGAGNTPAAGAAQVLDQSFASDSTSELAGHFVGLSTHQQVSEAVTQTLPLLAGASTGATSNTLSGINRVIQARQESNSGLSSGDVPAAEKNLWIKSFGSWADQSERSGVSGYDANTKGLAIGADTAVSDSTRLGVAFAYAKTKVDSDSKIAPQDSEIDTFQLIGYGSYALSPDTELNFQVDAGQNKNQGKRHMPFANATAKSDYDSYSAHAGVGLGHTLRFSEQLTFVPSVRADYTWIGEESYHEKGAGALDLGVDSRNAEELILGADGKLNYNLGPSTVLSANLGVGYDVINERASITSTYAGAPGAAFSTRGLDPEPWLGRAGLGLSHTLNNGTELSVRYDAESRSDFLNQGASVKARWNF
ncbi:autotransporter domain-containing protein [Pseudomonas putida]|uniref:autotransporter domain-containing protein n=1 Tax=Pseudomonas putida TaxID=303 RepID=UPI002364A28B|nr:autotransporter domain-containing protein [Pseudomonas putida]MDD2054795.1 autotransporter domain-containing protein [Pseudomonas putida]